MRCERSPVDKRVCEHGAGGWGVRGLADYLEDFGCGGEPDRGHTDFYNPSVLGWRRCQYSMADWPGLHSTPF